MDMKELAQKGQEIYEKKHKKKLERSHPGQFVAIEVFTGDIYLGATPEEAAEKARDTHKGGFFHLIRIGFDGAYRMGTLFSDANYSVF